jgi:hypothetical protein
MNAPCHCCADFAQSATFSTVAAHHIYVTLQSLWLVHIVIATLATY